MELHLTQYIETALWSSNDNEGRSLDSKYDFSDIDKESLETQRIELEKFLRDATHKVGFAVLSRYSLDDLAHDFWLTRNRHGCGFGDGDYPECGDVLTELAESFGPCDIVVGDNGKLYFEKG